MTGSSATNTSDSPAPQTLWTRSFTVICIINFLNSVCFLLLMTVLSKVATDRFQVSPAVAGLAAGIFIIGAFVTRPFLGKWINHIGWTRTLYLGSIFGLLLSLAYFAANSTFLLLVVRFLHGAAHSASTMAINTMVASTLPRGRYGEGIGYFTLGQTVSTAVGPFAGLILIEHGGFNCIVITCAVISAISLLCVPFLGVRQPPLTTEQLAESKGFGISSFIELQTVPVALAMMITYLCYSSVSSFLVLYAEHSHLTNAAKVFFPVYAAVVLLSRPVTSKRFDTRGENSVMYIFTAIFALGLGILALATHGAVLLLSAAIMGLGFGALQFAGRAVIIKITPLHRMGQAVSTFYIFGDIGLGIGPLVCGLLIPWIDYRGMYGAMAALAAASIGLYHVLYGRHASGRTIIT